ncbi:MAG TPA: VWA domain-containing protein [Polyangiaceae bacterium]|nr:VWA domain-containing protein [Polyangiaceae bacterium]
MTFFGLPPATLLGLLAGLAAVTVVLYILKLRRRGIQVAFAPLWRQASGQKQTNTLFSQLKRWLSLLLQLLIVALLILALGDPRGAGALKEARNIVVLIDASASMKAVDVAPSRISEAKRQVKDLVSKLSAQDRMLIVQLDVAVTPRSAFTNDIAQLTTAIDQVRATDTVANVEAGLLFAHDSLQGQQHGELIVVSDGAVAEFSSHAKKLATASYRVSFMPIGKERDNVAITQFSVRRYPLDKSRSEAMLEVSNLGQQAARVQLTLLGDDDPLESVELSLAAGQSVPRFYRDLASVDQRIEARISVVQGQDWLPADNQAFALVPERRRTKVALVSPGNSYLEAALLLDEYLEVALLKPTDPAPKTPFDVAILDGVALPQDLSAQALLYLNAQAAPVQRGAAIADFGFDAWEKTHPVLRYLALENVQVNRGFALKPGSQDKVIGRSDQGPLLVSGVRDGRAFLALGFDPRDSDIVLRPAWPLLLLNAIDYFAKEDSQYLSSYRTGETWQLAVPSEVEAFEVSAPDGDRQRLTAHDSQLILRGSSAGYYQIASLGSVTPFAARIAANLMDIKESTIAPLPQQQADARALPTPQGFQMGAREQLWIYLVLAVFLISVVEWFTYHRRVTV